MQDKASTACRHNAAICHTSRRADSGSRAPPSGLDLAGVGRHSRQRDTFAACACVAYRIARSPPAAVACCRDLDLDLAIWIWRVCSSCSTLRSPERPRRSTFHSIPCASVYVSYFTEMRLGVSENASGCERERVRVRGGCNRSDFVRCGIVRGCSCGNLARTHYERILTFSETCLHNS